jgi:hypothetical protein
VHFESPPIHCSTAPLTKPRAASSAATTSHTIRCSASSPGSGALQSAKQVGGQCTCYHEHHPGSQHDLLGNPSAGPTRSQWESTMQEMTCERKKHRLQRAYNKGTWVICKPCWTIVAFRRCVSVHTCALRLGTQVRAACCNSFACTQVSAERDARWTAAVAQAAVP